MKKLVLLFLLALTGVAQAQPSGQQIICNKTFQVSQGAVALTKVISGAVGSSVSICGVAASAGAATASFGFSYGTGTNCATGTVTVYPLVALAINGAFVDHISIANIGVPSVNASGVPNDVCLVTTGTGPISVIVYYQQ